MNHTVRIYIDAAGKEPFTRWFYQLRDDMARRRILARLRRREHGNRGDCKSLQGGVHELRLMFGPGYRIYYGEAGGDLIVLLCGGD